MAIKGLIMAFARVKARFIYDNNKWMDQTVTEQDGTNWTGWGRRKGDGMYAINRMEIKSEVETELMGGMIWKHGWDGWEMV